MSISPVVLLTATACSIAAIVLPPRTPAPIERSETTYDVSEKDDLRISQLHVLLPRAFGDPSPLDAHLLLAAMSRVGPFSEEALDVVEEAFRELLSAIGLVAVRMDEFERANPNDYAHYPHLSSEESRAEVYAINAAIAAAEDRMISAIETAMHEHPHPSLVAAANLIRRKMNARLRVERPVTRYIYLPELSTILEQELREIPPDDLLRLTSRWDEESNRVLRRFAANRHQGFTQFQTRVAAEGLSPPPNRAEWDPADRARSIEIFRRALQRSHNDLLELVRTSMSVLEQVHQECVPSEARAVRVEFIRQLMPFRAVEWPHRLARVAKSGTLSEQQQELVTAWDQRDLGLLRELVAVILRDTEPHGLYPYPVEAIRPELGERIQRIQKRRDEDAQKVLELLNMQERQALEGEVAAGQIGGPSRFRMRKRDPFTVHESWLSEVSGTREISVRAAPAPLPPAWVRTMDELLGPVAASAINIAEIASAIEEVRRPSFQRLWDHMGVLHHVHDGTPFDEQAAAALRATREDIRLSIANEERALLDQIERLLPITAHPERIRLRLLARRATENRMIEADRQHLAPSDSAAMIEPLSALLSLGLSPAEELALWREIDDDAEAFVAMRRAWQAEVLGPALDVRDAALAVSNTWGDPQMRARLKGVLAEVKAVHARHAPALGDAAINLVERIEAELDEITVRRFRRAVRVQVCPAVWGYEPSAIVELRDRFLSAANPISRDIFAEALAKAEADDEHLARQLADLIGTSGLLPAPMTDAERQVRMLTVRRSEEAEFHLTRAIIRAGAAEGR